MSRYDRAGAGYGYEIFKLYKDLFGKYTRTIYYNLKRHRKEEIMLLRWRTRLENILGEMRRKIYYTVGPYANINLPEKELEMIKNALSPNKRRIEIDWENELKTWLYLLKRLMIIMKGLMYVCAGQEINQGKIIKNTIIN